MVFSTFFSIFSSFNLQNCIFQSANKCKMTSFYMTSFHVDRNEAAKCVDDYHYHNCTTHIASLLIVPSHNLTKYKMATIFGLPYEN